MANHFATLNLSPGATVSEIKSAYKRAALIQHPDKNPGDPSAHQKMIELKHARDVLVKQLRRKTVPPPRPSPLASATQPVKRRPVPPSAPAVPAAEEEHNDVLPSSFMYHTFLRQLTGKVVSANKVWWPVRKDKARWTGR